MTRKTHSEIAENIVTHEGFALSLAASDVGGKSYVQAREELKAAIVAALADELARGIEYATGAD